MSTPTAYLPPRVAGGEAQRLARDAAAAAEVRTWQTHPDVVALRVLTDTPVRTAQIRELEHAAAFAWPGFT